MYFRIFVTFFSMFLGYFSTCLGSTREIDLHFAISIPKEMEKKRFEFVKMIEEDRLSNPNMNPPFDKFDKNLFNDITMQNKQLAIYEHHFVAFRLSTYCESNCPQTSIQAPGQEEGWFKLPFISQNHILRYTIPENAVNFSLEIAIIKSRYVFFSKSPRNYSGYTFENIIYPRASMALSVKQLTENTIAITPILAENDLTCPKLTHLTQ